MSDQFTSVHVNQIPTHILSTDKFKTNSLSLYIRQPLEEEHHTKVALIPGILKRGTQHLPTARHIRQALDNLYGASLDIDVSKKGEEQVVAFRLQLANEKFLSDQTPLFKKGVQLLAEVLSQPVLEEGAFSKKYVQLEKDLLHKKLRQLKDDKVRYANKRCTEVMFATERFRLFANGSEEQIDQFSAQDLYEYYLKMLQTHPMELYVVGDVQQQEVEEIIQQELQLPRTELLAIPPTAVAYDVKQERVVTEQTKIAQGKLHIGCRTHTSYHDDDYLALLVYNGIFGGFSHSKLFIHVREKESLAYYVSSSLESHKGLMMIMSGIEFKNYEKTVAIIKEQLNHMVQGKISEEEMAQTKAVLYNQIKQSSDQPFLMMERDFHGVVGGVRRTTEEVLQAIEKISIADVQKVAQKIEVDTIYFLTTEEGKEE